MADEKLSALPAGSAISGANLFYGVQGGTSVQLTGTQLLSFVGTAYVPFTGATSPVNLNTQALIAGTGLFGGAASTGQLSMRSGNGSAFIDVGSFSTSGFAGLWINQTAPSLTNYSIVSNGSGVLALNSPLISGTINFVFGGATIPLVMKGNLTATQSPNFYYRGATNLNSPATLENQAIQFNIPDTQWATGNITLNEGFVIVPGTWTAAGTSVMSDAYTFSVSGPPTITAPLSATRKWAGYFGGNVDVLGHMRIVDGTQSNGYLLTSDASGNTSWTAPSGGAPAGSNTYVQFNRSGSFGADLGLTYSNSGGNSTLTVSNGFPTFNLQFSPYLCQMQHSSTGLNIYADNSAGTGKINFTPQGTSSMFIDTSGITIGSGKAIKLGNAAVTGLTAGVLAALTNASLTIVDSTGQVYRIPVII